MKYIIRALPAIIIVFPALPAASLVLNEGLTLTKPYTLSIGLGIFAIFYLLNCTAMATRIRLLDHLYGHTRVMRFHGSMAITSLILVHFHRILKEIFLQGIVNFQTRLGSIALFLITTITALTLILMVENFLHRIPLVQKIRRWLTSKKAFNYQVLKIIHNLMALGAFTAAAHSLLSHNFMAYPILFAFLAIYTLVTLYLYINFQFIRPIRIRRKTYRIHSVQQMGGTITDITLVGPHLKFKAGQFAYISFQSPKVRKEEHPFTISGAPNLNNSSKASNTAHTSTLRFSIKSSGDYTSTLPQLSKGDKAWLDGPYGKFTLPDNLPPALFLAGGIGITPFHSIIQDMANKHRLGKAASPLTNPTLANVRLIWAVTTPEQLIFHEKFISLNKSLPWFHYTALTEHGHAPDVLKGRISRELIRENLSNPLETLIYLCGPGPMHRSLISILKNLGIPSRNIRFEKFSLG